MGWNHPLNIWNTNLALLFRESVLDIFAFYSNAKYACKDRNRGFHQELLRPRVFCCCFSLRQRYEKGIPAFTSTMSEWKSPQTLLHVRAAALCCSLTSFSQDPSRRNVGFEETPDSPLHISASRFSFMSSPLLSSAVVSCRRIVKESHWPS